MNHVHRWINSSSPASELIHVVGMGGIGKTALLCNFLNVAREHDMRVIWVDGKSCSGSIDVFLETIEAQLSPISIRHRKSRVGVLADALSTERTLLCIDDFDHLESIQGWLRTVFMHELPAEGLLVALSSRKPSPLAGGQGRVLRLREMFMTLGPLTRGEVKQYLEALNLHHHPEVELLIQQINGHPVALIQAVQHLINVSSEADGAWPISHTVSRRLLREFMIPELHEALDVLAILPDASYEVLNGLLASPLNVSQWHQLTQLSFVLPTTNGVGLNPVARTHLLNDFKRREPERFQNLRDQIITTVNQRLNGAEHAAERAITLMVVNRDVLNAPPICVMPDDLGSMCFGQFAPSDLMDLHQLIADEQIQQTTTFRSLDDAHRLLDDIAHHFPESIRVLRGKDGKPAVFHAGISLGCDSCEWVESHHPKVLAACFGEDYNRMRKLHKEDADTYFHLLGGASRNHTDYCFQELHGYMLLDGFSYTYGNGMRLTMTTSSKLSEDYFSQLGSAIRSLPGLPVWHPASTDLVMEFDWRRDSFGGWLQTLTDKRVSHLTGRRVWQATEAQVKECLSAINHPHILERTVLGRRFGGMALHKQLQSFLNDSPAPPPLNTLQQNVLRLLSQNPRLQPESAAQELSLSRSAYYRHRRAALTAVASLLSNL